MALPTCVVPPRRSPRRRCPRTRRSSRSRRTSRCRRSASRMSLKATEVLLKLLSLGMTGVNINSTLDADTAKLLASEFGWEVEDVAVSEEQAIEQARKVEDSGRRSGHARFAPPSSPSWVTSTTARPRCSTESARPKSPAAKLAASPSTSARTGCKRRRAPSPSSTRPVTKRSRRCVRAAPR